jgi:uncharacterized protein
MSKSVPIPRLTVITLGVNDIRTSIAFYEALGFARKFCATGDAVAFFDTGGTVLGLFPWDQLAHDATLPEHPRPQAFRLFGVFCRSGWTSLGGRGRSGHRGWGRPARSFA